jgi:hypothetical protein
MLNFKFVDCLNFLQGILFGVSILVILKESFNYNLVEMVSAALILSIFAIVGGTLQFIKIKNLPQE